MALVTIGNVEVAMNTEDGIYVLQYVRQMDEGRQVQETVVAETIPDGLRALASAMVRAAHAEFRR